MLRRQAIWIPTVQYFPHFVEGFHAFLDKNPITELNLNQMGMRPENSYVALVNDRHHSNRKGSNFTDGNSEKKVAALLAFPITISPEACDYNPVTQKQTLSMGFATGICDSTNSMHVMLRLLPRIPWHVSVNMQTQINCEVEAHSKLILISYIDKIGKRLAFCTTEAYYDVEDESDLHSDSMNDDKKSNKSLLTPEFVAKERSISNIDDLQECLRCYTQCITGAHVKAIIDTRSKEKKS